MQGNETGRSRLALVSTGPRGGRAESTLSRAPGEQPVRSPFSAAVPDRYFETAALRECHSRVARAALESDAVAVVEGEQGSGKTTFARMLHKRVGPSRDLCYIDVHIPQGERHVLDRLQRVFHPGQPADLDALTAELIERGRHNGGCLIVVDDADNLSVSALRLLMRLKRAVVQAGSRLGVIITASPSRLNAVLELPSLAPYRGHRLTRVELPRFSEQETADYLRARVESAGMADAISFDPAQVSRIHKASGGLPYHIKRVAGELLDGARPRHYRGTQRRQRHLARFRNVLIPVAAVALPVIGIGFLLQAITQDPEGADRAARFLPPGEIEAAGTAVPLLALPATPAATGVVERAPAAPPPSATPPAPAKPAVTEPPRGKLLAPEAGNAGGTPAAAPAPRPPADLPVLERAADAAPLGGNEWLRAQDPEFYTIQLAGSTERKDVERFIDRYALPGKAVVVEVLRNGKVWYMVLYNSYRTSGEAQRDLDALPPQIHRNDPFARRFSSVQAIARGP